ncbi:hypothetical protein IWX49DRAFT_550803 [Phyllosticta citricarpa]|uniref:SP-RING-type domain-containing protein n=2 Tax=Phyllosticta TaxID=121621 RepID=A0ABR1MDI0_9PEZI
MNRNHVDQPNATATAWLGGRNYDWLSTASPATTTTTTTTVHVRPPKRRRTNPQPTSPTSPDLPRRPSDPVPRPESPGPAHLERPPFNKRANTAPDAPRTDTRSPQELRGQLRQVQDLNGTATPHVKQESSATHPASKAAPADATGRLPTPRSSIAPLAAESPSPPPSRTLEENTAPLVPTPTSAFPSPQAQTASSLRYACFDRQACLNNVQNVYQISSLSSATRARCCSLQQAMKKNDHEYMLLHQFMSMAGLGDVPAKSLAIKEAMSHLASITTVAFGEPAAQSPLQRWFCDVPLNLKTLQERDTAHCTFHYTLLSRHAQKLNEGWNSFEESIYPFTVPDFQAILGLQSPQWQRLANMAKVRLLIQALGIPLEVAKEHEFEQRLMKSFQTHQACMYESRSDPAEAMKFRQEAREVIEQMKKMSNSNHPSAINLDFHQAEPIHRQAHPEPVARRQQSMVHNQQSEQISRQRQWLQEQAKQRQAIAAQQHPEHSRPSMVPSQSNAHNTIVYNPAANPHNGYFNQPNYAVNRSMSAPQDPRHQPHQIYRSPIASPNLWNPTMPRHQSGHAQPINHQHQSPVQSNGVRSPSQFNWPRPQHGMQEHMGQRMTNEHQMRVSGNGLPYGMASRAHLQAPQLPPQQSPPTRREKLFQSVVDFAIPPQKLGDALGHDFEFEIPLEDVANIPRKAGDVHEQTVVYRLRCIKVPDSGDLQKEWMSTSTTWPMGTLIIVNGSNTRPQKQQDKWIPLTLCPFINSPLNKFSLEILRMPEEPALSTFAVAVEKIKFQTGKTIFSLVTSPERVISAISVISSIRSAIDPKTNDEKDSGDEIAITMSRITINLIDPQSASRICDVPVRSLACHHRDCFDLATFLSSRPGIITGADEWRCPICRADARPAQLIVDGFLMDVRKQLAARGVLDTASVIIVEADGSWSVKKEARGESEKRATSATAGTGTKKHASAPTPASASAAGGLFNFASNEAGPGASTWFMAAGLGGEAQIPDSVRAEVAEAVEAINSVGSLAHTSATSPMAPATATTGPARGSVNVPIIIDLSDDDD